MDLREGGLALYFTSYNNHTPIGPGGVGGWWPEPVCEGKGGDGDLEGPVLPKGGWVAEEDSATRGYHMLRPLHFKTLRKNHPRTSLSRE